MNKSGVPRNRRIGGLTNLEVKYHDTFLVASALVANNGTLFFDSICEVPQNNSATGRIGRRIYIRHIELKGSVRFDMNPAPSTSNHGGTRVRMLLVMDRQNNSTQPTVPNTVPNVLQQALGTNGPNNFYNLENIERYKILWDKMFRLEPNDLTNFTNPATPDRQYSEDYHTLHFSKSCNIRIDFQSGFITGDVTTMTSNNIFLIALADEDDVGRVFLQARIRYTD